jgi:rSAM/selenodomain-associated transferase 1
MARAPLPGAAKTRLQPLLGPQGCARLQAELIRHTMRLAERAAPADTYLALDPPDAVEPVPDGVRRLGQQGEHLGARMSHAVKYVLRQHTGHVLVIGTDAPTLCLANLREAATYLDEGHDVVFGPAVDGGYYLVGLRDRSSVDVDLAAVFGIDPGLWGGPGVLAASLALAHTAGLRCRLLEPLRDLDTPADARVLVRDASVPPVIAELLRPPVIA